MRLKVRYIKTSQHTHTHTHPYIRTGGSDGMHWCDYTKKQEEKRIRGNCCRHADWSGGTFISQRQKVATPHLQLQLQFQFELQFQLMPLLLLLSAACFPLRLFISCPTKQTHLLHCFCTIFSSLPSFFCLLRRPFNWKIGTVRRLACKATITIILASSFALFFLLSFSFFFFFFGCVLLLLLLPLSVGHAPATLHWRWPWTLDRAASA